jgi:hypothetical protein
MISESHADVRRMLERMVVAGGDVPVVAQEPTPAQLRSVDALLLEPASPRSAKLARLARAANPSLSIRRIGPCSRSRSLRWNFADWRRPCFHSCPQWSRSDRRARLP